MTIKQLLNLGANQIQKTSASPYLDAEVLLSYVLKKPKEYLITHHESRVTNQQTRKFLHLIKKRAKGWPVAYLTGTKEFYGLTFQVNKNVLIPRSETETLVDLVVEKLQNSKFEIRNSKLSILDIGSGSGCIIISLAKKLSTLSPKPYPLFYASDISSQALKIAKKNAKKHGVKINFKQGNLLKPWKKQHFDIIVANLPYGWKEWKNNTSTETIGLKFEPKEALFTSKKGLALYEKLFKQVYTLSPAPCTLFLEFDPRQTTQIKKLTKKFLPDYLLEIKKDFAGKNRFVCLSPHNLL